MRLQSRATGCHVRAVLGDVRDRILLQELLNGIQIDAVFHAAACKHVPLLEGNPFTAASVNVVGTHTLIRECERAGVGTFVLLSTDKAVDPISVLGVTKRIAERISLGAAGRSDLEVKILRLGNVLGSTGSIVPLLLEQIANGEDLTITHPEVSRYFLSGPEATQHLLHALALHGEPYLWVPLMGEQRRVRELAEFLIQEFAPPGAVHKIRYTGLRPGDKLHERAWSMMEKPVRVGTHLLAIHSPSQDDAELASGLDTLEHAIISRDLVGWLEACKMLVPEYEPSVCIADKIRAVTQVCTA